MGLFELRPTAHAEARVEAHVVADVAPPSRGRGNPTRACRAADRCWENAVRFGGADGFRGSSLAMDAPSDGATACAVASGQPRSVSAISTWRVPSRCDSGAYDAECPRG